MKLSLKLVIENFKKLDPQEICEKSGARFTNNEKHGIIYVLYLGQEYMVSFPEAEVKYAGSNNEAALIDKEVILHYLITSKGTQPAGKLIDFRQVPGGNMYYQVFEARVHKHLLQKFGTDPLLFIDAAVKLGAEKNSIEKFAVKFSIFPKVPAIFILYKGDDEFPADCKVLFDANITDYLSTEGIAVACEELAKKITQS